MRIVKKIKKIHAVNLSGVVKKKKKLVGKYKWEKL